MSINILAQIAQILNVILVAVSVFFIWREVRETARLTRASNAHKLTESSGSFYLLIAQSTETAAVWLRGSHDYHNLTDVDKYRYRSLMDWWLNFYENIYLQQRDRLLDEGYFRAWSRELYRLVRTPSFPVVWNETRDTYSSDFIRFIEGSLRTAQGASALAPAESPATE